MMTLLNQFFHPTCYIHWLLNLCPWIVSDNKYQIFIINALLGHYRIVIIFFHSCMIAIFQENNSYTRKKYLEKYIAPFPRLNIMNVFNWFGEYFIFRNTVELCIQYGGLKNFSHMRVYLHTHEIYSHSSTIYAKNTNFDLKMEQGLLYV